MPQLKNVGDFTVISVCRILHRMQIHILNTDRKLSKIDAYFYLLHPKIALPQLRDVDLNNLDGTAESKFVHQYLKPYVKMLSNCSQDHVGRYFPAEANSQTIVTLYGLL